MRACSARKRRRAAAGRQGDAHAPRETPELLLPFRKHVRLELVEDLQAVLDRAQVDERVAERAPEAGREIAALGEAEDRAQAVPLAQPGVVAAVEELERLDEELHLANAAHAELDVAARAALGAKRLVDRILHLPHLADDRGVEARPEDEGADHLEEARGHRRIARTEARLDQRLALPELGPVREVGAIAVERQHEGPHPALRAQSQIHAEGVALLGDRLERVRDEPHRLGEEVAVGDRPLRPPAVSPSSP
jgi:hypothetical protein